MRARTKRWIAALLMVCMLVSVMPVVSLAAETESAPETVNYGFDILVKHPDFLNGRKTYQNNAIDATGTAIVDAEGNPVFVVDYLADLYAKGKVNYVLEDYYSQNANGYKNIYIRDGGQGHRLLASNEGDWVAFRLKAPGAGTATITLTNGGGSNTASIFLLEAKDGLVIKDNLTADNLLVSGLPKLAPWR